MRIKTTSDIVADMLSADCDPPTLWTEVHIAVWRKIGLVAYRAALFGLVLYGAYYAGECFRVLSSPVVCEQCHALISEHGF